MKRSQLVLVGSIWAVLGASTLVACGDDSEDDSGQGGSTSTGGKSATGGKTSTGGASTGGTVPGTGGKTATGGAGGSEEPGGGGAAGSEEPGGEAGSGGAVEPGGPISESADVLLEGVNDLRGLTFAADGKIYGSGHIGADNTAADRRLAIVRLTADGELDDTFGEKGIVSFNLRERVVEAAPEGGEGGAGGGASEGEGGEGGASGPSEIVINDGDEQSLGVVELENGDVIVQANVRDASGKGSDVMLLRLDSDGELVDSFGEKGIQKIDFGWSDDDAAAWTGATGPSDQAWGVSLDNTSGEEKLVVFGFGPAKVGQMTGDPAVQRTDNDRYIARVLADDGSFDPDFNDGEVFSYNSGGTFNDNGRRGLVLEDGSLVSGGYTNYGEGLGNHILVIQLTPEGTPDPSFGFGIASPGVARTNPFLDDGGVAECYGVAVQKSGRYVTTGYGRATVANGQSSLGWETTDGVDMISVALLPEGNAVDTGWGKQGTFVVQSEGLNLGNTEDRGRDLLALPDDRLVYAGRLGPNPALFVATAKGELDASVGEDGVFSYDALTDPTSHFFRITASADSKRIAASTSNHADGVLVAILDVGEQ
jgi:uncharacterized delta-60 repeat protein